MTVKNKKLGVFSFFSGIGLLDLGFHDAGFETLFVNEYHTPFLDAYKAVRAKMRHPTPKYGYLGLSVEEIKDAQLSKLMDDVKRAKSEGYIVGFIGGPPCPDFSIGGKNRGKDGENGKLSKTYVDLIEACQPDWFLFENVKGLWRTKRHREFYDSLKADLSKAYKLSDRLINSIEAGAPQDRDRIFLFGRHDSILHASAPIDWEAGLKFPGRSAFSDYDWPSQEEFADNIYRPIPNNVPLELTVQHWFEKNMVETHENSKHHFRPKAGLAKFKVIDEGDDSKKSFKRLHRWRYSPTAAYGNNEVHLHPYKPRRLSAAEALALQTAPADFVLPCEMSLTNMFKSIGNGVPYLVALHTANAVVQSLETDLRQEAS